MDDELNEILKEAEEKRRQLGESQSSGLEDGLLAGLAGFGAAFQGKDSASASSNFMKQREQSKAQQSSALDKWREQKIQEMGLKRDAQKNAREDAMIAADDDINSQESKMANELAGQMGYKGAPITATQFKSFSPVLQKKYEIEQKKIADNLTRQDRRDARDAATATKKDARRLPPDKVLAVNEGNSLPGMLRDLGNTIDNNSSAFGPILGRARSYNPYDETAQALQSQVKASAQTFGRYMEGGVLRKEDETKYEKMFPNASDTPESAKNKLAIVNKLLVDKQRSNLEALKASGYDTSGVEKEMPEGRLPEVLGASAKDTKTVNGITYRKVPGGWEELPMPASR